MRHSLRCRLGWHTPGQPIAVHHLVRMANGRRGSRVMYRCRRCGRRYHRWTDRYLWKLETVQSR